MIQIKFKYFNKETWYTVKRYLNVELDLALYLSMDVWPDILSCTDLPFDPITVRDLIINKGLFGYLDKIPIYIDGLKECGRLKDEFYVIPANEINHCMKTKDKDSFLLMAEIAYLHAIRE